MNRAEFRRKAKKKKKRNSSLAALVSKVHKRLKKRLVKVLAIGAAILVVLVSLAYVWYGIESELSKEEFDAIINDVLNQHPKQEIKRDFTRWLAAREFRVAYDSNMEQDVFANVMYTDKYEGGWQLWLRINIKRRLMLRDRASFERVLWHEYWHLYQAIERKVPRHLFLPSQETKMFTSADALLLFELELEAHEHECLLALYQGELQAQPKYNIYQIGGLAGLKSYLAQQFLGRFGKRIPADAERVLMKIAGVRKKSKR